MKVYRTSEFYVALDDRGYVAPGMVKLPDTCRLYGDPESFLRLAYTLIWVPANGLSKTMQELEGQTPLWERPDPSYTMYDCGNMMIARDQAGELAPLSYGEGHSIEAWKDPLMFMRRNAEGNIAWTSDLNGTFEENIDEKARYEAVIDERGYQIWHVPVPPL